MFHSPSFFCVKSSVSCFSSFSRFKSSGGGKVPERKGKQKDTLYLAFDALPYINGQKQAFIFIRNHFP